MGVLSAESIRRFNRIEGRHLALVITVNLFVAVIPLLIVGYAILEGFNPHRSFGGVIVESFHLTGTTAQIVQNTFATAKSGQSVALSISVISLLITGFDVSATAQVNVRMEFAADAPKPATGGEVTLLVDGKAVAAGRIDHTVPIRFSAYAGMDIGRDNGGVVDLSYEAKKPFAFHRHGQEGRFRRQTPSVHPGRGSTARGRAARARRARAVGMRHGRNPRSGHDGIR
jgi:hypothetical protein